MRYLDLYLLCCVPQTTMPSSFLFHLPFFSLLLSLATPPPPPKTSPTTSPNVTELTLKWLLNHFNSKTYKCKLWYLGALANLYSMLTFHMNMNIPGAIAHCSVLLPAMSTPDIWEKPPGLGTIVHCQRRLPPRAREQTFLCKKRTTPNSWLINYCWGVRLSSLLNLKSLLMIF